MNYWDTVKLARDNEICIQPHVIPIELCWRMVDSSDVDFVENITWSDVIAQTELKLDDSDLAWLEEQSPDKQLQFLEEELGYKGVLLVATSTKQFGESGYYYYFEGYAYLPDPDWAQIGTELGKLIQRVLASWKDKDRAGG